MCQFVDYFLMGIAICLVLLVPLTFLANNDRLVNKIHRKWALFYLRTHKDKLMQIYNQIGNYGANVIRDKHGREMQYSTEEIMQTAALYGLPPIEWGEFKKEEERLRELQKTIGNLQIQEITDIEAFNVG